MARHSFDKITVKDLMDATNMNRQSFYYYFRDTWEVLLCREKPFASLADSELEFSEWTVYVLMLMDQDRNFFRRMITAEFMSNAVMDHFLRFTACHDPLDVPDRHGKIQYLIGQIKTEKQILSSFKINNCAPSFLSFCLFCASIEMCRITFPLLLINLA